MTSAVLLAGSWVRFFVCLNPTGISGH